MEDYSYKMNKKLIGTDRVNHSWNLYDDGSADAFCTTCDQNKDITPGQLKAVIAKQRGIDPKEHWSKSFECTDCWLAAKRAKEGLTFDSKNAERREDIAYAQSWNLAVNVAKVTHPTSDEIKQEIEKWQTYFYDKLTQRSENEIDLNN